ncbi:hypothetical protein PIB30_096396 [Stylosanthes scabra]|uniref:Uncharacterized protein n=1 Tax=Stylosanthes scabra TaxID=79078 RepID=A0ABU6UYD8_9FABA|nr:hypothetical protein [Stylosanthes scabra]
MLSDFGRFLAKYNVKEVQSIEMVVEDGKVWSNESYESAELRKLVVPLEELSEDDVLDSITIMEAKTPGTSASTPMTEESPALTQLEEDANLSTNHAKRARVKRQKFMFKEDDS